MWAPSKHHYSTNHIDDFKFKVHNSFLPVSMWLLQPSVFTAPHEKFPRTSLLAFLPFILLFCGATVTPGYSPNFLVWQTNFPQDMAFTQYSRLIFSQSVFLSYLLTYQVSCTFKNMQSAVHLHMLFYYETT